MQFNNKKLFDKIQFSTANNLNVQLFVYHKWFFLQKINTNQLVNFKNKLFTFYRHWGRNFNTQQYLCSILLFFNLVGLLYFCLFKFKIQFAHTYCKLILSNNNEKSNKKVIDNFTFELFIFSVHCHLLISYVTTTLIQLKQVGLNTN